jgi:hypothetical protein
MYVFKNWLILGFFLLVLQPLPALSQNTQEPALLLDQPNLPDRRSVRVYEYVPQNNNNIVMIVAQAAGTGKLATLTTNKFGGCTQGGDRRTRPTAVLDNPSADESLDVYIFEYIPKCANGVVVITTAAFDTQLEIDLIPPPRN